MSAKKYNPKTRAEFDAYARAMDAANEDVVKGAKGRDEKNGPGKTPAKKPAAKTPAKKTGKK